MDLMERLQSRLPPFGQHLGITYTVVQSDRIVAEMLVRDDLSNGLGTAHGGTLMAFADTLGAVGTAISLQQGERTTTLESKTNFIAGAPVGTKIVGESIPLHRGRRTHIWETKITNEAGKLVAKVTQTQMVL